MTDADGTVKYAAYTYLGASTVVQVDHPAVAGGQLKLSYKGTADGSYPGFDRFGRVEWQTWTSADGGTVHDRLAYGYDRASNRIWKMDHKANGVGGAYAPRHEAYAYDGLHRLVKAQRGMLKSGQQGGLTAPFGGDANADGVADWGNDYLAFQNGVLGLGQGWAFGDFDGNGVIDWDNDFAILQNGILFPPTRSVAHTWQWSLDALGNWRGCLYDAGDGATWDLNQTRTHNAVNEITDLDGGDWTDPAHDAAGNMTRAPRPGQESTPAETLLNVYDAWNRLVKVFKDSNTNGTLDTETDTPVAEYRYDGLNRRIAKAVKDGNNWDRTDYYYNESWQVLEERFADNRPTSATPPNLDKDDPATVAKFQYVWDGRYIDAPVLRDEDTDSDGDCTDSGGSERLYYTNDANMNVTALVSASTGAVVERYWYDPYGQVTILNADWSVDDDQVSDKANEILYCGYRFDPETGLYHVRHRYSHPTLGRWCQRDADYYDGMSLYEYGLGSPVDMADPLGRWVSGTLEKFMQGHTALMSNGINSVPRLAASLYSLYRQAAIQGNLSMDADFPTDTYILQGFTDAEAIKHFMVGQQAANGLNHPSPQVRQAAAQAWLNEASKNLRRCTESWRTAKQQVDPKERERYCEGGWRSLGKALHTLQDAFAHTGSRGEPLTSHEHGGTLVGERVINKWTITHQLIFKWQFRDNPALNRARFQQAQQATNAVIGAVWRQADGTVGCNCIEQSTGWGPI